jgi:molybdopterin-containing oxidoreductase family iron-sulfur binding subunit
LAINQVWQVKRSVLLVLDQKRVRCKVTQLIKDMKAGSVHTLIMSVNPVYMADSSTFVEGLKKVKTSVSFSLKEDETALVSTIAAAVPYLESWNDEYYKGTYGITQPTIRPLLILNNFKMSCYL